jgi:hypothetical protein
MRVAEDAVTGTRMMTGASMLEVEFKVALIIGLQICQSIAESISVIRQYHPFLLEQARPASEDIPMRLVMGCIVACDACLFAIDLADEHDGKRLRRRSVRPQVDNNATSVRKVYRPLALWHEPRLPGASCCGKRMAAKKRHGQDADATKKPL